MSRARGGLIDGALQRNMYTSTSVHSGETTACRGPRRRVYKRRPRTPTRHGEAMMPQRPAAGDRSVRYRVSSPRPDDARPDRGRSRALFL